jgi:hypothetical protein
MLNRQTCVRHDVAVELTDPIDQAVGRCVVDEDVSSTAAVGDVGIRERRGIRSIVETTSSIMVIVGIVQVIAQAAEQDIVVGPAD